MNDMTAEHALRAAPQRTVQGLDHSQVPNRMSGRQRFLAACAGRPVDHPPVWLMRQAGRVLPEYRALKEKFTFHELIRKPELATEVTLQPIRRFGFDAAILFSDILVVAEALGQSFQFADRSGVCMDYKLDTARDITKLDSRRTKEHLSYVSQVLSMVREELGDNTALLGFAGSPWTLANFMLEGGSSREYVKARALYYSDPGTFHHLFETLTDAVVAFLELQIDAGVDAVQIFDSLGGCLAADAFPEASARWMQEIISRLGNRVPVIVFSKGTHGNWEVLTGTGAQVIGVDWTVSLKEVRRFLSDHVALQGNLDPVVLTTTKEATHRETRRILEEIKGHPGHIFNLGHGVPPSARLENIETLLETVRSVE